MKVKNIQLYSNDDWLTYGWSNSNSNSNTKLLVSRKYISKLSSLELYQFVFWLAAFPTGGFSHSFGFESATKHGFVTEYSKYETECSVQWIVILEYTM